MARSLDSLEGRAELVRDAYFDQVRTNFVGPGEPPHVAEVFPDHVIVSKGLKYFSVPYTVEGDKVAFGEESEVRVEFLPVSEAMEFLGEPTGRTWEVRLIQEGVSKRNFIYPRHALETLIPFVDRTPVMAFELRPGLFGHVAPSELEAAKAKGQNRIGELTNARAMEADGGYEIRADLKVEEGWVDRVKAAANRFGLSINGLTEAIRVKEALVWVNKFLSLESVDLATVPSAGGGFIRATETFAREEVTMLEKLFAMLKAKRPDLAEQLGDEPTVEQVQEALLEAIETPAGKKPEGKKEPAEDGAKPESITAQEAQELRSEIEQAKLDRSQSYLERRLGESNLPGPVRKKVEKQFAGKIFAREALDEAITLEKETLDQLGKSGTIVVGSGDTKVVVTQEALDKHQIALDKTLGVRVEGHDDVKRFRGLREAYVQITGDSGVEGKLPKHVMRSQEAIVAADFPNLLNRTMNRRLVQDYAEVNYGESLIVSFSGEAMDFKIQEANRVGYFGDLPIVDPETADYTEAVKPGEESIKYNVETRGQLLVITRKTIINDDLSGITRRVRNWGRAARRTYARFVWNFFIANSTYDGDSTAWFTVGHGNLKTEALAGVELVDAIQKLMDMTEPDSGEKLGLDFSRGIANLGLHLVVPTALWDLAVKENEREYLDANFTPNAARFAFGRNSERVIVNPLLSDANDWGVFANSQERDIIEVKFLNGQEDPETFLQDQPTVGQVFVADKLTWKIRHEYGGDILDFRGAVKSVVA